MGQSEEVTVAVVATVAVTVSVALVAVDIDALDVHILDAHVLGMNTLAAAAEVLATASEVLATVTEELTAELETLVELAALVDGDLLRDEDLTGVLGAEHDLLVHDGLLENAFAVVVRTLVTALLGQFALDKLDDLDGPELAEGSSALDDLDDLDDFALGDLELANLALKDLDDLDESALGELGLEGLSLDDFDDLDGLDSLDDSPSARGQLAFDDLHDLELRLKGPTLDELASDCDGLLDANALDQATLAKGQEDTRAGLAPGDARSGWREKS